MIAFANTGGGSLIIGIDDSQIVVGVDKDTVFQIMDAIAVSRKFYEISAFRQSKASTLS